MHHHPQILTNQNLTNAVSDFETFLHSELETIETLTNYLDLEFERLIKFKKDVLAYKMTITNGVLEGVDNPVQFYLIIKNVTSQWNTIDSYNVSNISFSQILDRIINQRQKNNITVPISDDLYQSLNAMARLQDMYNLQNNDILSGKIAGLPKTIANLDANDCLQLGKIFFTKMQYDRSVSWMEQALIQLEKEENHSSVLKKIILKHYAYALYKQGKQLKSEEILLDFLNSLDTHEHFYDYLTTTNLEEAKDKNQSNVMAVDSNRQPSMCDYLNCTKDYKSLCNGEINNTTYTNQSLSCYYKKDRPFLKLAPIKVEVVSINPEVYFFRQVISDNEIETVVTMARTQLQDAQFRGRNGSVMKSDYRTAKVAWFSDRTSSAVAAITRRIHDMTNLTMTFAEPLQVAHYGIGGHYDVHHDASGTVINDRMATVILYLSTPEAGGATVFPLVKITAYPQKNDALLWYNTLKNGNTDFATFHAGCPVLSGKKWIANKWIHSFGQEFIRQCSLEQNE